MVQKYFQPELIWDNKESGHTEGIVQVQTKV